MLAFGRINKTYNIINRLFIKLLPTEKVTSEHLSSGIGAAKSEEIGTGKDVAAGDDEQRIQPIRNPRHE
jgi:hypothetical protein